MKKFPLIAGLAALLLATAVHAAPASMASVEQLLVITRAQATQEKSFAQLDPIMHQMAARMFAGQQFTSEQQAALDNMLGKYVSAIREEFAWDKVRPLYVQIYQETFSQEEVDGLIAFYRTPVGASTVEKLPLVAQRSMGVMQERMGPVMQKMQAAMREAVAGMQATDKEAAATAPAK